MTCPMQRGEGECWACEDCEWYDEEVALCALVAVARALRMPDGWK